MATQPRTGFVRVGEPLLDTPLAQRKTKRLQCGSRKFRYATESDAIDGLMRVRTERIASGASRPPENRLYFCERCGGWHLTSKDLHPHDLEGVRERGGGESWEEYAKRLERKIAAQRGELVSLLALGHGGGNRELRKRIPALLIALAQITERWQSERQNRQALTEILRRDHPLCWLIWRLMLGRR